MKESKKAKTKQNKTNVTEKDSMASSNHPEDTSSLHLRLINYDGEREPARTHLLWPILSLVLSVTFGHTTACHSPASPFSALIHFTRKRPTPCSAVLRHPPSSWAAVIHWTALILKALRPSRKHHIHYMLPVPPTQPALPTSCPNTRPFDSLASSLRATNSANRICLLRIIASMLSLPVFMRSVSV